MIRAEIRHGAYYDSVVLMQLQRGLAGLAGVDEAGVVMGTDANKELLAQSDLLPPDAARAEADDLLIVVRGLDAAACDHALAAVDSLLVRPVRTETGVDYRPKTLVSAVGQLPAARWVLVSTPGRYAAGVAREALRLGRNVFLYSDNVAVQEEIDLKRMASQSGLLVLGPDCGTAIINGVGLGFANRVRAGAIGVVGASGTGLQQVTARIHQLGGGITHALGTGGRDLSDAVGAVTARQALDLLSRDPNTSVIVLISKPPSPAVAADLLNLARASGKAVVVDFIGYQPDAATADHPADNLHFVKTLDAAAELAVRLADTPTDPTLASELPAFAPGQRYLRGLFSGGTLAYEAMLILRDYLPAVHSNAPLDKRFRLENSLTSREHTVIDLGEDEFTVGRLHPMLDNELRIKRLRQEAADPETALILLDVVLGYGAHPDPAGELAPEIAAARAAAADAGRHLEVVAVVVGTDDDPQGMDAQMAGLRAAGAQVEVNNEEAVRRVGELLRTLNRMEAQTPVALAVLQEPLAAINVGLEAFTESLIDQEAPVVHVDWRPPAGGNEKLLGILARMKD